MHMIGPQSKVLEFIITLQQEQRHRSAAQNTDVSCEDFYWDAEQDISGIFQTGKMGHSAADYPKGKTKGKGDIVCCSGRNLLTGRMSREWNKEKEDFKGSKGMGKCAYSLDGQGSWTTAGRDAAMESLFESNAVLVQL